MIRFAENTDIPYIVDTAELMHKESRFATRFPFDREKFEAVVSTAVGNDRQCVFIAELNGRRVGAMIGLVSEQFFSAALVAQDLGLYVDEKYRQTGVGAELAEWFYRWACAAGAVDCELGENSGIAPEGFANLMRLTGFREVGRLYSKRCQ